MAKFNRIFDRRFLSHWPSYVIQSAMAAAVVLLALIVLHQHNLVVVASLAASAFTVFTVPSYITASTRNVVGGHIIGVIFGSLFALIPQESSIGQDAIYALAVGGAMFAMTITNTEHPPAAGTALGVVIAGFSIQIVLGVVVGVAILAAVHRLLRPFLRDLTALPQSDKPR